MKLSTWTYKTRVVVLVALGIVFGLIWNQDSKLENMENAFPTLTGNNLNRDEITLAATIHKYTTGIAEYNPRNASVTIKIPTGKNI